MSKEYEYVSNHGQVRMKVFSLTVPGLDNALRVSAALACASKWFAFMPLPDDEYLISVRPENETYLRQMTS